MAHDRLQRIPLEVITEQSDDLIKKQIERTKRKNLSRSLRKKYKLPKACRKNKSKKNLKTSQINLRVNLETKPWEEDDFLIN